MRSRWVRILLVAFSVVMLSQQTTLGALVMGDECTESCPDDAAEGRCAPGCGSCSCPTHGSSLNLAVLVAVAEAAPIARFEADDRPMSADEIPVSVFHVPKPLLA